MLRGGAAGQWGAPSTARPAASALPRAGVAGSAVINTQIHPMVLRRSGAPSTPLVSIPASSGLQRQQAHGTQLLKWALTATREAGLCSEGIYQGATF